MSDTCFIRPYKPLDREVVRAIAWETAFRGESADAFFEDRELLCDVLTAAFTDGEPGTCWVAECEGKVEGYLLGTLDNRHLRTFFIQRILPSLLQQIFMTPVLLSQKNRTFFLKLMTSFFMGELRQPDVSGRFPAVLHINLRPALRSRGIGRKLIEAFAGVLRDKGIAGVQLSTFSDGARQFFEKQGFSVLGKSERSYWHYLLGKNVCVYLMGRQIS